MNREAQGPQREFQEAPGEVQEAQREFQEAPEEFQEAPKGVPGGPLGLLDLPVHIRFTFGSHSVHIFSLGAPGGRGGQFCIRSPAALGGRGRWRGATSAFSGVLVVVGGQFPSVAGDVGWDEMSVEMRCRLRCEAPAGVVIK